MKPIMIDGLVARISGNRNPDVSEKARIDLHYQCANVIAGIEFDVPFAEARNFWVGQRLTITIAEPK